VCCQCDQRNLDVQLRSTYSAATVAREQEAEMRARINRRRMVVASLLVTGATAPVAHTTIQPEPLSQIRFEQAEVTTDHAAIARHRALGRLTFRVSGATSASIRVVVDREMIARHRALGRLKLG
jgi:hypothetical protein